MPRGGGRGGKKSHKGQRRMFTQPEDLKALADKEERERQWRRQQGIESDEEEEAGAEGGESPQKGTDETAAKGSDSSSEEESSEEDESGKAKGVEHLIQVENPNRAAGKRTKKVTELGDASSSDTTNLSRREREELEKQEARRRYQQMHLAGKTEEAQADLARLAIIRKQREEAAKKKEEERKSKEEVAKSSAKSKGKS